jgi:hypothetical protein
LKDNELKYYLTNLFKDFESKPQEQSWEEIRREVMSDEDAFRDNLIQSFENFEAEPQNESWDTIRKTIFSENDLLSEDLNATFETYEPNPQKASWNIIKTALEDDNTLKADWSNLFADYEAEPQADSWKIIEEAIKKDKRRRLFYIPFYTRVGIAASILLLLGFFLFNSERSDNQGLAKKDSADKQIGLSKKSNEIVDSEKENNNNLTKKEVENTIIGIAKSEKSNSKFQNTISNNFDKTTNNENLIIENPNQNSQNNLIVNNQIDEIKSSLSNSLIINQLNSKNVTELAFQKLLPQIKNEIEEPIEIIENQRKKKNDLIFTSNLMPLSTYQAFTIVPQSSTYISQVGQLSALDKDRFGIQARVGVMKPINKKYYVGASLSYTGFQQWADYSFTNGVYDIEITDNDQYKITPLSENISESSFIHALGLKIENSYQINYKNKKIFLIGGGEAVRNLKKNQYGYYLNASVGFNLPMANNNAVWVEPTFRYGLTPSFDNNNYLKIQPYHLGLNLRMNIR